MPSHASEAGPSAVTAIDALQTRALLFTDVVDSTALAERLGDEAAARLWAAHDRVARGLLRPWHGSEIDKSDGLFVLFERVDDAVGYALAYHAALAAAAPQLKARAGVHVGPLRVRANLPEDVALGAKPLEVEGLAKPTTARIMGVALGGQTLLSASAQQAMTSVQWALRSHGHWRLKGVEEPIELFEVAADDARFAPPADSPKAWRVLRQDELWLPVRQVRHSLPAERDSFIGRAEALRHLARRVDAGARLLTVLGPGGVGKTRLVTRFGWMSLGDFTGGVWFCDLASARDRDGIVRAVAEALSLQPSGADPVQQIGQALAGRGPCLVLLDNFEQVAREAEATLGEWLKRAAQAQFIVTTREVLGIAGEEVQALAPLNASESAALFLRRAEGARAGFVLHDDDRPAVDPLMRLLEGLPLAIELAAARVRVLGPKALLARMSERFKLLTSHGTRVDRQATLCAVFDWSWDLLSAPERAALAQLSVFEGGFALAAVEAVLEPTALADAPWPLDLLQSLVDKSLVRTAAHERFELPVSLQEYAAQRLGQLPAVHGHSAVLDAQVRHGAYFAGLDEAAAKANECAELGNLVTACRRAVQRADAATASATLESACAALRFRGPFSMGVELAESVWAMPDLSRLQQAHVRAVLGSALKDSGNDVAAGPHFEAALALAEGSADELLQGRLLRNLGRMEAYNGNEASARTRLQAALALAIKLRNALLECETRNELGNLEDTFGNTELARSHYETALRVARAAHLLEWQGGVLGNLGTLCAMQGQFDQAQAHHEAALAMARQQSNRQMEGNTLCNLGAMLQSRQQNAAARAPLQAALAVAAELGHERLAAMVRCNLGMVADAEGQVEEALTHYETALHSARRLADRRMEGMFLHYLGAVYARQDRFDAARDCLDRAEAILTDLCDRHGLALLMCVRAEAAQRAGQHDQAQSAIADAERISAELGATDNSEIGSALAQARAVLA